MEATNKTNVRMLNEISYFVSEKIHVSKITPKNHVGVHNLLPDKQGKKDLSEHVPIIGFLTQYRKGDILIGKIGAYLRKIWLADHNGGASSDVLVIRVKNINNILPEFLYYVLSSDIFFDFAEQHAKGSVMRRIDKNAISEFPVPIPLISDQKRIVNILDSFTELTTELTTELNARKKQFEYYRDQLLTFDNKNPIINEGGVELMNTLLIQLLARSITKWVTYWIMRCLFRIWLNQNNTVQNIKHRF